MKKDFVHLLVSVCSGTKVFKQIVTIGVRRAIWHLIILSIICSICYGVATWKSVKDEISAICTVLQSEFGGMKVDSEKGIIPVLSPEKERHFDYNYFQFDYFPNVKDIKDLNINTKLYSSGIIWTPESLTGWFKLNNNELIVYPAIVTTTTIQPFAIQPKNMILSYIKDTPSLVGKENLHLSIVGNGDYPIFGSTILSDNNSFFALSSNFDKWSTFIIMFAFFASALSKAIFYSIIFALIYKLTGRRDYSGYKFKNFFVIAVYASMPAMIVGTLFSMTQTQLVEYSTVFIIVFIIYLFVILNSLRNNYISKKL